MAVRARRTPWRGAAKAFENLKALFEVVAGLDPRDAARGAALAVEITPLEYIHTVQVGAVTQRLRSLALAVGLCRRTRLPAQSPCRSCLDTKARSVDEVQRFVLSYLIIHLVTTNEPGLMQVFEALHFPLTTSKSREFGALPITRIGIGIPTTRPSTPSSLRAPN